MDCTNTKPVVRPNSNISEMVCKFAKVCKLKSIGVFSEVPNLHHLHRPICNEASLSQNSAEENKCYDQKVHPHPIEVTNKESFCVGLEVMKKIFDAVSALKLAYLQLQQAHIPYDPQKIVAADDMVVAELEKLCKFKREYKEKQCKKARFNAARSDLLKVEVVTKEVLLEKLKSQHSAKDSEVLRLRQELQDLQMGNKNLAEKIKQISLDKRKGSVLTVTTFQDVFNAASKSIHDFAKPLISLMKASGWDLDRAANSIESDVVYSKRCDKKYAFEAYIARRMFHGIALTPYDVSDIMKYDDPFDALMENPHSDFSKFCQAKYLLVVHPKMEESFFGNLDHRTFVMSGKHPRTEFYQLFAKMAKWVWVLLGSVVSIDTDATLFSVSRGSIFSSLYMESVDEEKESPILSGEERTTYKVQFMIMPGFKIGQMVVKSKVYISKHSSS
ncbi:protein GRAVITROPIC IN THE LIGHT 1-like [Abrus precatorius]|uniref:Protein GRAVITROPIC IN THE LIGHT 1-like n=1 Tax=Abrus precatorius TaxID=3816 RepID=A0A8B8MIQ9_ABRPR|nr:protein GRAVITROPIC IN THE LIGHT 1-like [Abrus precatorius]